MLRRSFLVSAGSTSLMTMVTPALSKLDITSSEVEASFSERYRQVFKLAQDAGMEPPAAAPGLQGMPQATGALADIVAKATQSKNDDRLLDLADQAGQLLSELNRFLRDRVASFGAEAPPSFSSIRADYKKMFDTANIDKSHTQELTSAAARITSAVSQARYKAVERDTGVPWYVIGALHYREANLNFMGHLHNGDFLRVRTVQVPAGRPAGPWPPQPWDPIEAWRLSAIDALKSFSRVSDWSVERMLYTFEAYNGWGYRSHKGFNSPYLWNYTQYYKSGGYPCDHCWSTSYKSKQAGLVSVLKTIKMISPDSLDFRYEA